MKAKNDHRSKFTAVPFFNAEKGLTDFNKNNMLNAFLFQIMKVVAIISVNKVIMFAFEKFIKGEQKCSIINQT